MVEYIKKDEFKAKYLCCGYLPEMSEEEFDQFPAADVAPVVHGRWVFGGDGCVICSKCNEEESNDNHRNYCPNCGAKMDGGEK